MYNLYKILILIFNLNNIKLINCNEKFHVCGSYCGPNWCNNMWLSEDNCDTSIAPEYHKLTGYSCSDICCKHHDKCCGHQKNNKTLCNKEIVNCLKTCNPLSLTCTIDFIPIPSGAIELAMNIVEDWCCGEPCK